MRIFIDGFNLLHSVVLKKENRSRWWSVHQQLRVIELVSSFSPPPAFKGHSVEFEKLEIVFDASSSRSERAVLPLPFSQRISLHYAPSADDWIVEQIKECAQPAMVVSADRPLTDRARHLGALKIIPWQFSEYCSPGF